MLIRAPLLAFPTLMSIPDLTTTAASESREIRVVGRLPLKLSGEDKIEFERLSLELAAITRRKDSVIFYSCNADIESPGTYVFDEIWPSFDVFQQHLQTDHFKAWWAWVEPKLAGSLAIDYVPVSYLKRVD